MAGVLIFVFLAILIFGLAGLLIFGLAGVCGSGAGQHGVVPVLSAGGPAAPGQRGGRPSHRTLRLQPSHRPSRPQKGECRISTKMCNNSSRVNCPVLLSGIWIWSVVARYGGWVGLLLAMVKS